MANNLNSVLQWKLGPATALSLRLFDLFGLNEHVDNGACRHPDPVKLSRATLLTSGSCWNITSGFAYIRILFNYQMLLDGIRILLHIWIGGSRILSERNKARRHPDSFLKRKCGSATSGSCSNNTCGSSTSGSCSNNTYDMTSSWLCWQLLDSCWHPDSVEWSRGSALLTNIRILVDILTL